MAPAKPPRCGCWPPFSSLPTAPPSFVGHDIVEHPEKVRASIGFLSTATALYPRLTAQEMVEYFGRLNGLDEATLKKRVDDIFNRLDMDSFRDRRCDKLSTGMKQKTSIARTLVHDPPVMIFDEPTLGLDIMAARTIVNFIRECRRAGKTVIFSTHIMTEVEKLCDVVGIIHRGKLLAEGTPAEVARYLPGKRSGGNFRKNRFAARRRRGVTDHGLAQHRHRLSQGIARSVARPPHADFHAFSFRLLLFPVLTVGVGYMIAGLVGKARRDPQK